MLNPHIYAFVFARVSSQSTYKEYSQRDLPFLSQVLAVFLTVCSLFHASRHLPLSPKVRNQMGPPFSENSLSLWSLISIEIFTILPNSNSHTEILVIVDRFSQCR